ncbi:GreA/GreB family elongation factor [Pseudoalteromonas sp. BZB3]|uniref:GreA/GreB family elongation factor n=1 Tax=Pseudoalteromonas sp. BZB3 TaxID=3136670 RepID=UPI0032C45D3D
MNKQHFIEHLKFALEAKLQEAVQAANSAREDATHEQSAAETQYDSLSIESAYLAQGQSERVDDAHKAIKAFNEIYELFPSESIVIGSLVSCENEAGDLYWYFIGPTEGGLKLDIKGTVVWTITPVSPLGKVLMHKKVHDEFDWTMHGITQEFEITRIL